MCNGKGQSRNALDTIAKVTESGTCPRKRKHEILEHTPDFSNSKKKKKKLIWNWKTENWPQKNKCGVSYLNRACVLFDNLTTRLYFLIPWLKPSHVRWIPNRGSGPMVSIFKIVACLLQGRSSPRERACHIHVDWHDVYLTTAFRQGLVKSIE